MHNLYTIKNRITAMVSKPYGLIIFSLVLALTALALLGSSRARAGETALGRSEVIPASYFGMHMHRVASSVPWPSIPIGSWRLWDSYTAWPNLEPQKGNWQFATLDRSVLIARYANADLVLPLGLSPNWASARPAEKSMYQLGNAAEPANISDWRNYIRTVATRYKGQIHYYEIWNEPDLKGFYSGTPEKMAELTAAACEELKAVDPNIKLIGPSPTSGPHTFPWYRKFLNAFEGKPCYQIVGWHFYTTESPPEELLNIATKIRTVLVDYGLEKMPLWNTEAGYFVENTSGPLVTGTIANPAKLILQQDQASAFLARSFILAWATRVDRYYWYAWDDGKMGLLDIGTGKPKLAGLAMQRLYGWMVGSTMPSCTKSEGIWACQLVRDGKTAYLVWQESGVGEWKAPAHFTNIQTQAVTATTATEIGSRVIPVSSEPVLVINNKDQWNPT